MNVSGQPFLSSEPRRAVLVLEELTVAYGHVPALDHVSCRIAPAMRVAVVGPNGAGKSTLFKAITGLLPVQSGRVLIEGKAGARRYSSLAYVPQREEVDWGFPVTVEDVVLMGRYGHLRAWHRPGAGDRAAVRHGLEQLGIAHLAATAIGELSGGQQQRVFLARALAQEPSILILDEPFAGVDAATQEAILTLIDRLQAGGVTVLISTHDLSLAAQRFDQVLLLNRHLLAYGPPSSALTQETLAEAFGKQLFVLPGGSLVADHCCPPDIVREC